jgi:hypothetical protein
VKPALCLVLALCLSIAETRACPLCLAGRTISVSAQELVYARQSLLALPDAEGTSFRVVEVIKGNAPESGVIVDKVFRGEPVKVRGGTTPLLLIRDEGWPHWVNFGAIDAKQAPWLRQLAATKRTTQMNADEWAAHVAFLLPFLENPEPMVADITAAEISGAPYAALRSLKPKLDPAALRRWLSDPKLSAREPLYTLLLGIAGEPTDAERFEAQIDTAWKANSAANLGPLLAADLELRGPIRVAWIEEKYLRAPQRTAPEFEAALLALSEHGKANATIPRERVIAAYRVFLTAHPDQAGLVAKDLGDWGRWEFAPEFQALIRARTPLPSSAARNAILDYLLRSQEPAAK